MSEPTSTAVILSTADKTISAYCLFCGKPMRLASSVQRFCSSVCKDSFNNKITALRKMKRNEYQKQFRMSSYKTQVKHVEKIICPKCKQQGYLVRYTVRNVKKGRTVSVYETVRHQITLQGKSVLKGQCYIRSLPRENNEEKFDSVPEVKSEAHESFSA